MKYSTDGAQINIQYLVRIVMMSRPIGPAMITNVPEFVNANAVLARR